MSSTDTTGRVVMVSGANRGIGATIAARLAADGYRLSLGARRPAALAEHAPDIEPHRLLLNHHEATDIDSARQWVESRFVPLRGRPPTDPIRNDWRHSIAGAIVTLLRAASQIRTIR